MQAPLLTAFLPMDQFHYASNWLRGAVDDREAAAYSKMERQLLGMNKSVTIGRETTMETSIFRKKKTCEVLEDTGPGHNTPF